MLYKMFNFHGPYNTFQPRKDNKNMLYNMSYFCMVGQKTETLFVPPMQALCEHKIGHL